MRIGVCESARGKNRLYRNRASATSFLSLHLPLLFCLCSSADLSFLRPDCILTGEPAALHNAPARVCVPDPYTGMCVCTCACVYDPAGAYSHAQVYGVFELKDRWERVISRTTCGQRSADHIDREWRNLGESFRLRDER